jgi:glucan phosphoethanolaminetransferase (alkaline phosphatase superfamily)
MGFLFLYLLICFYLLPALAVTLKVRKHKLAQISSATNTTAISSNSGVFLASTKTLFDNFNSKIQNLSASNSNALNFAQNLQTTLSYAGVKHNSQRVFSSKIADNIQMLSLLFK